MAKHKGSRKAGGPPKRPALTHFLCVPLVSAASRPQLEDSLKRFRNDVSPSEAVVDAEVNATDGENSEETEVTMPHIPPKAIRPVGALHLTLGVMSLKQDGLVKATELLKDLNLDRMLQEAAFSSEGPSEHRGDSKPQTEGNVSSVKQAISPPPSDRPPLPLAIDTKGLVSMHPPQSTSILYSAPEDATGRLYPFCEALQKVFKDADLLVKDDRPLKLHATIVNTIYAKGRKKPKWQQKKVGFQQGPPGPTPEPALKVDAAAEGTEADAAAGVKPEKAVGENLGSPEKKDDQDDRAQGHGPNAKAPLRIDARAILEKYKDFVWAENVALHRVAICEMGAKKKLDADGNVVGEEYLEVATATLPGS